MTLVPHHLTVPRTSRYYLLGDREGAVEIWFVLHGYSQLAANFARWFEPAMRPGRLIVAPEGLSRAYFEEQGTRRVGASWMTKEDREAEMMDYVRYLDLLADEVLGELPPRPRVEVHGFSQGTATACRWVAFGRHPIQRLVLWGGTVPPDLDLDRFDTALRGGAFKVIIGDNDPFIGAEHVAAERARLKGAGLNFSIHEFSGGHRVDTETLRGLAGEEAGAMP